MKKLYIFSIAMITVSSLFAQDQGRNNYQKENDRNGNKGWAYTRQNNNNFKDSRYSNDDHYYNRQQPQIQEKDRYAAIDRVARDYGQRINGYRNNRSMKPYERIRRIAEMQRERDQKINSFGKGVITGAMAGLMAGVLFSN
ncbi:MAG: hypothetical protein ABI813_01865 [Bacteroidota bacterium]